MVPAAAPAEAWLALAYMVVAGSLVGFVAYQYLLREARPALAMSYAYVNPVLAVVLGATVGGESVSSQGVVALGLIALAVVAIVSRPSRPAPTRSP
jgi:drug/metabolite transporter (DMT)-like permease